MLHRFAINRGSVVPTDEESAPILVYTNPEEAEKQFLLGQLDTDIHSLNSALDPDEISRIEVQEDHIFIVWKRPDTFTFSTLRKFQVSSIGIMHQEERLIIILSDDNIPFEHKRFRHISSLRHLMLMLFLHTIHHFVEHLKVIKMVHLELQSKIEKSMSNQHLLNMLALSESLIYYLNAIAVNQTVLTKLKVMSARMKLSEEEMEVLEDIMIENTQCMKQAEIYSQVLSGLMDARGSIINNNMNVLIKNLTIINIIFLPLNLVASIGGMSEYSMFTQGLSWPISYGLFCATMAVVGWLLWVLLKRRVERNTSEPSGRDPLWSRMKRMARRRTP